MYFLRKSSNNFKNGMVSAINYEEIINLLKALYCYDQSIHYAKKCEELYSNNHDRIQNLLDAVSKGRNILRWSFTGKEKKHKVESYPLLKKEYEKDF